MNLNHVITPFNPPAPYKLLAYSNTTTHHNTNSQQNNI